MFTEVVADTLLVCITELTSCGRESIDSANVVLFTSFDITDGLGVIKLNDVKVKFSTLDVIDCTELCFSTSLVSESVAA